MTVNLSLIIGSALFAFAFVGMIIFMALEQWDIAGVFAKGLIPAVLILIVGGILAKVQYDTRQGVDYALNPNSKPDLELIDATSERAEFSLTNGQGLTQECREGLQPFQVVAS